MTNPLMDLSCYRTGKKSVHTIGICDGLWEKVIEMKMEPATLFRRPLVKKSLRTLRQEQKSSKAGVGLF